MTRAIVDRDRWLALGLLLLALGLAYLLLLHPWWTVPMLETQGRIETLQQRELRQRMQLRQGPDVARRLQQVQAAVARRPGFLVEATTELATASLVQPRQPQLRDHQPLPARRRQHGQGSLSQGDGAGATALR
jgi:general secretion pathway protein M